MNISAYILEYLKQFGTVVVPDFGVFSLENSKAIINSENGSILPPASKIVFTKDFEIKSDDLEAFIAEQKQISVEASNIELKILTYVWRERLETDHTLEIDELGVLFLEDGKTHFKGNRLQSDHPDFYGLEEINISDMNNDSTKLDTSLHQEKDYTFNKSILWAFLVIIPVLGILYVAYTQQELLFGEKSFDKANKISVQTTTHRIEDTVKVQPKIAPTPVIDSLKKDSVNPQAVKNAAKVPTTQNNN